MKTVEITPDVRPVLEGGTWEGWLFRLPPGQLERKLYEAVDKVLRALGGKWHRGHRGHMFSIDAKEAMLAALDQGHVVDRKRTIELFETPLPVADRMARVAFAHRIAKPVVRVLEPSAGTGRLLGEAARNMNRPGDSYEILAIDIDAANCEALRAQGIATEIICGDFLSLEIASGREADVILMNPPFGRAADIAHVTRAFHGWLAPGGVLVAIMSPHWTFAQSRAAAHFRDSVYGAPAHEGRWEQLPEGTFKAEGTGTNAGILILRKPGA